MSDDTVKRFVALAAKLVKEDELVAAEGAAEAALAIAPAAHDAWVVLGTVHARKKRHERAVVCFEQAIALDPTDVASHVDLGELLLELGAYARASAALDRAMTLDPKAAHPSGRRARAIVAKTLSKLRAL
ncbi:MAG: tetratricopeptide repeat protein [Deltaproteobacteria bacterium]|nr:tetratricopeptide repeat protein [Deltaproteobacteria bacterium]